MIFPHLVVRWLIFFLCTPVLIPIPFAQFLGKIYLFCSYQHKMSTLLLPMLVTIVVKDNWR